MGHACCWSAAFHGDGSSKDANDECAASELKTWNEVVGALLLS
jgi:hypothetical protein